MASGVTTQVPPPQPMPRHATPHHATPDPSPTNQTQMDSQGENSKVECSVSTFPHTTLSTDLHSKPLRNPHPGNRIPAEPWMSMRYYIYTTLTFKGAIFNLSSPLKVLYLTYAHTHLHTA